MASQTDSSRVLFPTLQNYDPRKQLFPDIVAGLTVGSLAVPQSMSYATIAGLPVQNGLYSDLQVAYPILGNSRHLVVGPVAIMSIFTYSCFKGTGLEPLTQEWIIACSLLSLSVGLFQFLLVLFNFGDRLSKAVSENTVKAFTVCAAFTITSTQIKPLLGIPNQLPSCTSCTFFEITEYFFTHPNVQTLILSFCSLIILEGTRCIFDPKSIFSKLGSLIVLISGILFTMIFESSNIQIVGFIPQGLPSSTPMLSFQKAISTPILIRILLFTVPLSLIGFAEAFAIAKTRPDVLNPNRELAALALANCWTSFLGGYPITGSFSRSAVNSEAGSTSSFSNFIAALVVVVVLELLTRPLSLLPKACVSAVVVSAIFRLIDFHYMKSLYLEKEKKMEGIVYFIIVLIGLIFGVEFGLLIGFLFDTIISCKSKYASTREIAKESDEEIELQNTSSKE